MTGRHAIERLLLFVREPRAGAAKTRLIPALGAAGAAELYRRLAEHAAREAARLAGQGVDTVLLVDPPDRCDAVARWLGPPFRAVSQAAGDLGARLRGGFDAAFGDGVRRIVAIGSDCPALTTELIGEAFRCLVAHDAVIGPAEDGGYYLIGLARPIAGIFDGVPWSTAATLTVTRERLAAAGASVRELPCLADVDTPRDLAAAAAGHRWLREALRRLVPNEDRNRCGGRARMAQGRRP